jgi:hypothetical protein
VKKGVRMEFASLENVHVTMDSQEIVAQNVKIITLVLTVFLARAKTENFATLEMVLVLKLCVEITTIVISRLKEDLLVECVFLHQSVSVLKDGMERIA